jgi:hypothetical protein
MMIERFSQMALRKRLQICQPLEEGEARELTRE